MVSKAIESTKVEDGVEYVSYREFARRLNKSHKSIIDAVNAERITYKVVGVQKMLPWIAGVEQYRANTDVSKTRAGVIGGADTYSESRAKREASKAKLAELDLQEKIGSLIPIEKVKKDFFELGTHTRGALFNIPTMISPELAAETNPKKIEARLELAIREALEALIESKYHAPTVVL